MVESIRDLRVADGDPVAAEHIPLAVTSGRFAYDDGATQVFEPEGATTYVEGGRPSRGEWYVDEDGSFCSYWPPTYRACYDLNWIVRDGAVVGLTFTDRARGSRFAGRYS